jgi:hypothetical protein
MDTQGLLRRIYDSPEAELRWQEITSDPNVKDEQLIRWYETYWNKYHDNLKKLLIPRLLEDYKARTAKLQELGPEKYDAWIVERNQKLREEFMSQNPDLLKEG